MVSHHLITTLYKDALALFCAVSIAMPGSVPPKATAPLQLIDPAAITIGKDLNERNAGMYTRTKLWRYLRKGINYLEASGEEVPLRFLHPGDKAYGPLALTPIAVKDVQAHYPGLRRYKFEDVISKRSLYEKFSILYADMLLRYYIKLDYSGMPKEEVFQILQKAWFLGPTLYMKGYPVIASREIKAAEYTAPV
ncbi:MAG: hypothetical protein Q8R38_04205 [Candidatus Omnitrophota bacterium]|nr:hypothetical protein [Candidatus Omnitrophota bacterium]